MASNGSQCHSPWFVDGGMSTLGRPVWLGRSPAAGDAAAVLLRGGTGNGGEEGDGSASGVERERGEERKGGKNEVGLLEHLQ
jgi:hypothetical protein